MDKEERFDYLVQLFLSKNIDSKEANELSTYLKKEYFVQRFDDLARNHAISYRDKLLEIKDSNYASQIAPRIERSVVTSKRYRYWVQSIAATIILAVGLISFYTYRSTTVKEQVQTYLAQAPADSQRVVTLSDGTLIRLNCGSILYYNSDYGKQNRTVQLSGEGYFEVTHMPDKPFIVEANKIKTQVFGTIFNIRNYNNDNEIWVDLIEGKVSVTNTDEKGKEQTQVLLPNRRAIYNKEHKTLNAIDISLNNAAAWINGKYYFVNTSFKEIAKYLERQYAVNITILSPELQNEIYTGSINLKQPIEKVFEYLDVDQVYMLVREGKEVTIKKKDY